MPCHLVQLPGSGFDAHARRTAQFVLAQHAEELPRLLRLIDGSSARVAQLPGGAGEVTAALARRRAALPVQWEANQRALRLLLGAARGEPSRDCLTGGVSGGGERTVAAASASATASAVPAAAAAAAPAAAEAGGYDGSASNLLLHLARDWSAEGSAAREAAYGPVLQEVARWSGGGGGDGGGGGGGGLAGGGSVLLPGCGLCRLGYELARRGWRRVDCNDVSPLMASVALTVLNGAGGRGTFALFPSLPGDARNRAASRHGQVLVPDVRPAATRSGGGDGGGESGSEGGSDGSGGGGGGTAASASAAGDGATAGTAAGGTDAMRFLLGGLGAVPRPPGVPDGGGARDGGGYDAVVTSFFLDAAPCVVDAMARVARLLRPGGLWVNVGPLKYSACAQQQGGGAAAAAAAAALTWEEVLALLRPCGFALLHAELLPASPYAPWLGSMQSECYAPGLFSARLSDNRRGTRRCADDDAGADDDADDVRRLANLPSSFSS